MDHIVISVKSFLVNDEMYGEPMDAVSVSSVGFDLIALWVSAWRAMKEIWMKRTSNHNTKRGCEIWVATSL